MVVGVGHIHAVLHPFVIFPTVEFAPLILGSGIRARIGLSEIFEFPCRRTSRVARLRVNSLGCAAGYIPVPGTLLFKVCDQINQNLVVIVTLLVPFVIRIVVSIQVDNVGDEVPGVESGGIFYPLSVLVLDVGR